MSGVDKYVKKNKQRINFYSDMWNYSTFEYLTDLTLQ